MCCVYYSILLLLSAACMRAAADDEEIEEKEIFIFFYYTNNSYDNSYELYRSQGIYADNDKVIRINVGERQRSYQYGTNTNS